MTCLHQSVRFHLLSTRTSHPVAPHGHPKVVIGNNVTMPLRMLALKATATSNGAYPSLAPEHPARSATPRQVSHRLRLPPGVSGYLIDAKIRLHCTLFQVPEELAHGLSIMHPCSWWSRMVGCVCKADRCVCPRTRRSLRQCESIPVSRSRRQRLCHSAELAR